MSEHPPIEGYDLIQLLARNGHLIYLARHSRTNRLVRLNVVHSQGKFGRMVADRLRHQAHVLATLNHPNIVRLVEVGDAQSYGFFTALEFVDGDSLADRVRFQTLLPHPEIIRISRLVASALDYAHQRNVVHGNVDPGHILLGGDGQVFLIGFAEIGPDCPEVTCFGNPHFLAPEQLAGFDHTVPQSDVYALAEVAFLLMSGSFPFRDSGGIESLLNCKCSGPVPSIREYRPELPRSVDRVLQQAMALQPADRYRSAGQFVEELAGALEHYPEGQRKWWQIWR